MKDIAEDHTYSVRLPVEDEPKVVELVKNSGQTMNTVLALCIRHGLPLAGQVLCKGLERVTAVDPLPDSVLEQIYKDKDELEGISAQQFLGFQSQNEPQ